ncbi:MAG: response regulator [Anaerolineae bacterium]|nr:response regulator [Anaerolineae bacterium]
MSKVMIVDDDRTTVSLLETLLDMDGFQVVLCPRGGEVIETMYTEKPDLVLMDYHLADMKGLEVLKLIRGDAEIAKTVVVMTSGLDVGPECQAAGANKFLLKPFDPGALAPLFNALIAAQTGK